jgi:hypothetical protein
MKTGSSLGTYNPPFAEVELDDTPTDTQTRQSSPTPAAQPIAPRAYDPLRARFRDMRLIADYAPYAYQNDGWLFYEQAKFMADIEDDYPHRTAFSAFYPYYQRMGYEQLRTYFTWRTALRGGQYPFAGASYLFLYIYELLSCIGCANPVDGLTRLVSLWKPYRDAVPSLDQYLPGWIRDFHIYYQMPHTFEEFVAAKGLQRHYPDAATPDGGTAFEAWRRRSGYDIAKSKFYTGNEILIADGVEAVIASLRTWCLSKGTSLEDVLLYDISAAGFWKPFSQALFHPWLKQPDRRVEMPGREFYACHDNRWTMEKAMPFSGSRELVGHVLRSTESHLRKIMKHKHKLAADSRTLLHGAKKLASSGLKLSDMDMVIEQAVAAFHREMNRIEVSVDAKRLVHIREEAQGTQEKLTVEEAAPHPAEARADGDCPIPTPPVFTPPPIFSPSSGGWVPLSAALSPVERQALALLCSGDTNLKPLADEHGIMLEVLAEGINEKAADYIGDNILDTDGGLVLYEEYREILQKVLTEGSPA